MVLKELLELSSQRAQTCRGLLHWGSMKTVLLFCCSRRWEKHWFSSALVRLDATVGFLLIF